MIIAKQTPSAGRLLPLEIACLWFIQQTTPIGATFQFTAAKFVEVIKVGERAVQKTLQELVTLGYLEEATKRQRDVVGQYWIPAVYRFVRTYELVRSNDLPAISSQVNDLPAISSHSKTKELLPPCELVRAEATPNINNLKKTVYVNEVDISNMKLIDTGSQVDITNKKPDDTGVSFFEVGKQDVSFFEEGERTIERTESPLDKAHRQLAEYLELDEKSTVAGFPGSWDRSIQYARQEVERLSKPTPVTPVVERESEAASPTVDITPDVTPVARPIESSNSWAVALKETQRRAEQLSPKPTVEKYQRDSKVPLDGFDKTRVPDCPICNKSCEWDEAQGWDDVKDEPTDEEVIQVYRFCMSAACIQRAYELDVVAEELKKKEATELCKRQDEAAGIGPRCRCCGNPPIDGTDICDTCKTIEVSAAAFDRLEKLECSGELFNVEQETVNV